MSTRWYYAKAGTTDRQGPVTVEQIQEKLRTGELTPADIIWRQGLPQWAPISAMPELSAGPPMPARPSAAPRLPPMPPGPRPASVVPVSSPVHAVSAPEHAVAIEPVARPTAPIGPASVGYFAPSGDMPEHARENLEGYGKATGPVGDWPLSEQHLEELSNASRLRKSILAGVNVCRLVQIVALIFLLIFAFSGVVGLFSDRTSAKAMMVTMFGLAGFMLFVIILMQVFAGSMRRCRAWASLVMAILMTLYTLLQVAGFVVTALGAAAGSNTYSSGDVPFIYGAGAIAFLILSVLCFALWKSYAATSKFLNTPVWCQEALVVAETA